MSLANIQTGLPQGFAQQVRGYIGGAIDFESLLRYGPDLAVTIPLHKNQAQGLRAQQTLREASQYAASRSRGFRMLTTRVNNTPLNPYDLTLFSQLHGTNNLQQPHVWGDLAEDCRIWLAWQTDMASTASNLSPQAWLDGIQGRIATESSAFRDSLRIQCTYSQNLKDGWTFLDWRMRLKDTNLAIWEAALNFNQQAIEAELHEVRNGQRQGRSAGPPQLPVLAQYTGYPASQRNRILNAAAPEFQPRNLGLPGQHRTNEVPSQAASRAAAVQNSPLNSQNRPDPGFHVTNPPLHNQSAPASIQHSPTEPEMEAEEERPGSAPTISTQIGSPERARSQVNYARLDALFKSMARASPGNKHAGANEPSIKTPTRNFATLKSLPRTEEPKTQNLADFFDPRGTMNVFAARLEELSAINRLNRSSW